MLSESTIFVITAENKSINKLFTAATPFPKKTVNKIKDLFWGQTSS